MDDRRGPGRRPGAPPLGTGLARRLVPSDCVHPRLRLATAVLPNLAVLALVAAALVVRPQWPVAAGTANVAAGTVLVVAMGAVVILAGDLLPVLYRPAQGRLIRWSVPFVMALLAYGGLVPALVLSVLGSGLLSVGSRRHPVITLANVGGAATSVLVVWAVLTASGWRADLVDPWVPAGVHDVTVLLVAVFVGELAYDVLFVLGIHSRTGTAPQVVLKGLVTSYREAGGLHQLAMTPVIVVIMAETPLLTALMILPVTAVHRATVEQAASAHAASHDGLTQLANRGVFVAATRSALEAADRTGRCAAVLAMDLDRFKQLNDELGHPVGDEVLVETARRLRLAAREDDVVGRMGGDEFAVLLVDLRSADEALAVARRLNDEVGRPFQAHGHAVELSVSVGVAVAPQHGGDFDDLYLHADTAMFAAKRHGDGPRLYAPQADPVPDDVPARRLPASRASSVTGEAPRPLTGVPGRAGGPG